MGCGKAINHKRKPLRAGSKHAPNPEIPEETLL
jgi:hypothetical protein